MADFLDQQMAEIEEYQEDEKEADFKVVSKSKRKCGPGVWRETWINWILFLREAKA